MTEELVFEVGDKAEKSVGDYDFSGTIIGKSTKLSGQVRYDLEDEKGSIHIFSGKQLRKSSTMKPYIDLVRDVMKNGVDRGDRTGTGTRSVFGRQIRFDLSKGFPLLTEKKMTMRSTIEELLWFLSGSTNVNTLPDTTKKWWTPWQRANGDLGPIYGEQYRTSKWWYEVEPMIFETPTITKKEGLFCGVGIIGESSSERGQSEEKLMLKSIWRDMLKRCYDENSKSYSAYGGSGVHVDPDWLEFDNFARDAIKINGWNLKKEYPEDYTLDKDIKFASNRYSKETCMWASHNEQSYNTSTGTPFTALSPEGEKVLFASLGEAQRNFGLNISAVHRCLTEKLHTHHGWSNFEYIIPNYGKVIRFRELDQLRRFVSEIKHNPNSRRHLINLWHSPAMEHAELPCCHGSIIQGYVSDGKLSLSIYQRSADIFIGVPVNIASYALLTHMLSHVTGLEVGEIIFSFGDLHLYHNHFEQAKEMLERESFPLPKLTLNAKVKNIDDFVYDDIVVSEYQSGPAIKAPVAV